MKRNSQMRYSVAFCCAVLLFGTGCPVMLPGDFLSSLVLRPDSDCAQIAQELDLGPLRSTTTPSEAGLSFTPLSVTSANGAKLSGWFIPAQRDGILEGQPEGTVLITHGTDGSIACALPWASVAALNGFHAVLFDYQGFGESEGTANIATLLDDSDAVLQWIVSDAAPARQKVHLLGVSLGTGPAFGLVALRDQPQVQSLLVDGAFDPELHIDSLTAAVGSLYPTAAESARAEFKWLFDTRANLVNVRVPVMFIMSELDGITPPSGAQAMEMLLPTFPENSWLFQGLGHVQPLFKMTENYVSLAVTFWRSPDTEADPLASVSGSSIMIPSLAP